MSNPHLPDSALDADAGVDQDTAAVAARIAALGDTSDPADEAAPAEDAGPPTPRFSDMALPRELDLSLEDMGYFTPTPVQAATYAPALAGKDLMVQARTGTGKTTAFGLPILSSIDTARRVPQAIILTPTRELALQVSRELGMLGKHKGLAVE